MIFLCLFKREVLFEYISDLSVDERLIFVIDEFPYLSSGNTGFLSKFQHMIDHKLQGKNMMIILCGSSIGFMENEVLSEKSPIFGRLTRQLLVNPFDYYDAAKMLSPYSCEEKLETSEELFNAPANLIRQELRSPAIYNSILEAVSNGYTKSNEINTK